MHRRHFATASLLAASLALPAVAHAARGTAPAPDGDAPPCRIRVIDEQGAKTVEIDLSRLGDTIAAAMSSVSEALAGLDTIRVHRDGAHRLVIREDGHEAVIDVDAIMRDVNEAVALALAEAGHGAREAGSRVREGMRRDVRAEIRRDAVRDAEREDASQRREELKAQMEDLRAEMRALRDELRRLRDDR